MEDGSPSCVRNKDYVGVDEEEEEGKEQCSPVSVLDPPFDTDVDDDGDNNSDDGDHRRHQRDYDCEEGEKDDNHLELEDEESYELQRSFDSVKRTKQKLLHKLRRFERLAELNPTELEKRMLEVEDDDDDDDDDEEEEEEEEEEEYDENYGSVSPDDEESFVETVYSRFLLCDKGGEGKKIPRDMKLLILDMIAEEGRRVDDDDENGAAMEEVVKNVSKRLDSCKGVESDTIDMMVDLDLRREGDDWRRHQEQVQEMAIEIEFSIFGLLLQELSDEIARS